jgi:hypothetical protein
VPSEDLHRQKNPRETREITDEMAVFKQHDQIMGRLYDINEATSDLAAIMDQWHPGSIPDRMPPTALVNLRSKQYDAVAKDLSAWLSETRRKGGAHEETNT